MLINILKNRIICLMDQRIHQGIAFEWTNEEVLFADIEYPEETGLTGLPIVAYFLTLNEEEQPEEGLLQIIEDDFKMRQGTNIEHFVGILIKSELGSTQYYGFRKKDGAIQSCKVTLIEDKPEVIYFPLINSDSTVWLRKRVVIVGCGTFGSSLALELCKVGVNNFVLVDYERFKKIEIHRTIAYAAYEGRKKNQVLKEALLLKNPMAKVTTLDIDITAEPDVLKNECKQTDIIVGLTNQRPSFFLINQIALELNTPVIFGITNNLASFGYIYRFDPSNSKSPCLNCMGVGQFFYRGEKVYYERSGPTSLVSATQMHEKEEALNIDLLPYVFMLTRVCLEILSEGLMQALPEANFDESSLLIFPTGYYPEGQDPISSQSLTNYKKMQWYPVTVKCDPGCPVCSSRN